jgi:hypothetical protein
MFFLSSSTKTSFGIIMEQPRRPRRQSWNLGRNQRQSVESHNIFF